MKFLKNKVVIGVLCIIVAVVVVIFLMPKDGNNSVSVVKLTGDISTNTYITEDMVKEVSVSESAVSSAAIKDKNKVIGKYSTTNIYKDDFITDAKLSNTPTNANLYALNDKEEAMSITVPNLAASVSGKIMEGDVINLYYYDNTTKTTYQDENLRNLEVLSVSNSDAQEVTSAVQSETDDDNVPATITVKINSSQAVLLVNMQNNGSLYASFVARGDKAAMLLGKPIAAEEPTATGNPQ